VRGVSDKMLIQHLKELEAHGVIVRTDYHEIPPRVDYTLVPLRSKPCGSDDPDVPLGRKQYGGDRLGA